MRVRIIRPVVVEFVSHDWRRGEAVRLRDPQGRRIRGQLGWILNSELKNCGLKIITKFTTEFFLDIKLRCEQSLLLVSPNVIKKFKTLKINLLFRSQNNHQLLSIARSYV